jgi:hypothetical protein
MKRPAVPLRQVEKDTAAAFWAGWVGARGIPDGAKNPKGYIYFSIAFAFWVDIIQMKTVKNNV